MQNSKLLRQLADKIQNLGKGFTLIELLVVVAIIGILSAFLLANFVGLRQRARDGVRKSDLRQIQVALEAYRSDLGKYPYPASLVSCGNSLTDGSSPPVVYMRKISCDPLTNVSYQYDSPSSGISYCLRTCLENAGDGERDGEKYGSNNPVISGCTLSDCSSGIASYTLQNP